MNRVNLSSLIVVFGEAITLETTLMRKKKNDNRPVPTNQMRIIND